MFGSFCSNEMTSASARFSRAFKTVNYCLIYHVFKELSLLARCVRMVII